MFEVVLFEPEIPTNTGNIARLCAGTGSSLTLVEPLGFSLDSARLKRAGLDYWQHLDWRVVNSLEKVMKNRRFALFSKYGTKPYWQHSYQQGDLLIFGKETTGLPKTLIEQHQDCSYFLPMPGAVRSINLSNTVAVATYEGLKQHNILNRQTLEAGGDESYVLPFLQV